jgi:D-alanine-D-alanine ligase
VLMGPRPGSVTLRSRPPRVLVAYNEPVLTANHPDAAAEYDVVETSIGVEKILLDAGFAVARVGYARHPRTLLRKVRAWKPDVVFNLFEGEADRTETEISNAAVLEWTGVPFTGSPSTTLALGRDKIRTKFLLQGAGLPTAPFVAVEGLPAPLWPHAWPAIVKPACQDASVGIDQEAVVTTQKQLEARAAYLFERYGGPVLVEQFVSGREFHVNVFEAPGDGPAADRLVIVPLTEIRYEHAPADELWPIYSYKAKWDEASAEHLGIPISTGLTLPGPLMAEVSEICKAAYRLIGLRDYGRVDLRLTADNKPYVLEVNPNPYLYSIGLVEGVTAMGGVHSDFILDIVRNALTRVEARAADWQPVER